MSQPPELTHHDLFRSSPASGTSTLTGSTPRGPTFLSTSTTPSPPPSPPSLSMPTFTDALDNMASVGFPSSFSPLSYTAISPPSNATALRHPHSALQPIPLPPPTLRPSTRPPPSLNPPNAIAHTNTSPLASPYPLTPTLGTSRTASNLKQSVKPISHSASASLSTHTPRQTASAYRPTPKRSPSMSVLESGVGGLHMHGPPEIPLRISSIPPNQSPRKLSLPSQKSYALLRQEASDATKTTSANTSSYRGGTGRPRTPPQQLMTMKELPSPPTGEYDEGGVRGMVMGSEPQMWSQSPPPPPTRDSEITHDSSETRTSGGHGEMEGFIVNPIIPPSPPQPTSTHSRTNSTYSRSYSFPAPPSAPLYRTDEQHFSAFDWMGAVDTKQPLESPPAVPQKSQSRRNKKARKVMGIEDEGTRDAGKTGSQGRPVQMSKTQREKDRKKRGKAKIVIEHVDIIGDKFWERRPWILSGRAG